MDNRKRSWFRAFILTLAPVTFALPIASTAAVILGGSRVWLVVFLAPITMWIEAQAIAEVLGMYRRRCDPFLIAMVPLGLASLGTYALSGILFVLAVPSVIRCLA
ncbi:MAG TPA: hypothetical protein VMB02_12130 [Candidatus Aquilonibacter sp.]|nr:hypothetical protein [Candidatus Aquilonibacter sp.]